MNTKGPARGKRIKSIMVHCKKQNLLDSPGCAQSRRLRYRGVAMVWSAIMMLLMVLLLGLLIDTARVALVLHQMHNAADAGALAGACVVKMDQLAARQQAILTAYANLADHESVFLADNPENVPDGDVVLGRWIPQTKTFIPTSDGPNAVKVVTRRTDAHLLDAGEGGSVPLIFGGILANVFDVDCVRHAIARSWGSTGAGLIALDSYPTTNHGIGLQMGGNVTVNVANGDIQVNSESTTNPWQAFRANGDFIIECSELNVCGKVYPVIAEDDPGFWATVDYAVNEGANYLPDPLEGIPNLDPLPALTAWGNKTINNDIITSNGVYDAALGMYVLTLSPGYYPGGIRMTATNCKLVLEPGIYAFGGQRNVYDSTLGAFVDTGGDTGLYITGGTFEALDSMLYITDSPSGKYGIVDIQGGGNTNVTITEYKSEGSPYDGMAIFQDRDNTREAYITGSSEIHLEGSLYFKHANFRCGGGGLQAGTQLVAGTVEVDGNSVIYINYDGRYRTVGNRSHLVE